jgi:hypothetical protein
LSLLSLLRVVVDEFLDVGLYELTLARISSAVAVQVNGVAWVFQRVVQSRICLIRTVTEVKVPRRMDWRVMMPNQVSIWLIHDDHMWRGPSPDLHTNLFNASRRSGLQP